MRRSLRSTQSAKKVRVGHSDIGYLYRYDTSWNQDWKGRVPIFQCWEYPIISETPHTYLIYDGTFKHRRIYKNNRRAWAHANELDAKEHFVKRKLNQYSIISAQLEDANQVLRVLMEDWGQDTGQLPNRKTIHQVFQEELEAQRLEDLYKQDLI
ncbi:hypothetical protein [Rhizobium phage RHEph16]|uniref:Uncharacterized protein n=1 Tax=Rhizobium phage RHEph16 TaxID=2836132 RepID=A0AAE7VM72_9CAUD|nr:hypothetical protein PP750_gp47 [Rhizobium phage RHEph16]QXV74356.1 hypothetical protein [Rhizobium phage RHEph16]